MAGNLTEVVTALTSTTVAAGGSFSFSARTSNLGNTSTGGGSTSRIFLSADPLIDPFDTVLQIRTVPTLGAFGEFAQNYVVTVPPNLVPGTYYIGGLADFHNQVAETNEGDNNFNRIQLTVTAPPNLTEVVTALTSTTVAAGGSFSFATNTVNNGPSAAAGSTARIYISTDSVITAQDTLLASHVAPSLGAGQGSAQNFAVNLPGNLAPGTYYIGGLADYFNQVGEGNEGDNNGNVVTVTVTPSAVDLRAVVTAASNTTVNAGGGFSFRLNTVNEGSAASTGSTTFLYLSTDPVITRNDRVLGFGTVGALNPGAGSGDVANAMVIPADLAPGTYYVGAIADNENQVAESNEANNNGNMVTITVVPRAPDLQTVVTSTGPGAAVAGSPFIVGLSTLNTGTAASQASTARLFLSTDRDITAQDTLLPVHHVSGPLDPGAMPNALYAVDMPAGLAPGTYYLGAVADFYNQVGESNEFNNNGNTVAITVVAAPLYAPESEQVGMPDMNASSLQLSHAAASSFVGSGGGLPDPVFQGGGDVPALIVSDATKVA
jgi:subtilase family serine protease